ncbi:hypothetical protein [Flavobacterium gilvum]|uniref:Uncharacterized protein n=1 Tax=Flavobacterium gilvum TaxID=1492737 RepID=A0AAC9N3U7_9FLAO|nr:hypothetical protein [Flavobacterium gilvum]AOW09520.1 hypothetical protein EM308_08410 [Flavobacterium gilvum]KFC60027.1 hypothetical protein FEM08_12060 [Flavobacterium gilvum]
MKTKPNPTSDLRSVFANRQAKESAKVDSEVSIEEKRKPFIDRFGAEKLDQWKKEYGGRQLIYLKHENDMAVLRPPTADDLGEYMMSIGTNGMSKAVAFILEQLWLEGDHPLVEDEDKFIAVFLQINNLLEGKKADYFRF